MKIVIYSEISAANISKSMGLPDYSYYFVLRDYLPVLNSLGSVYIVEHPESEVDDIYDEAKATGEQCVFFSFTPPHKTITGLRCPTIPVFAWEFDCIPNEPWLNDANQDWRHPLSLCGYAITHSQMIVTAVRKELGKSFPVISIPSPVWDKFEGFRTRTVAALLHAPITIRVNAGVAVDSQEASLAPYISGPNATAIVVQAIREHEAAVDRTRHSIPKEAPQNLIQQTFLKITKRYLGEWYLKVFCQFLAFLPKPTPKLSIATTSQPTKITEQRQNHLLSEEKAVNRLEPPNIVEPPRPQAVGITPPMPTWTPSDSHVCLSGIVFTAIFNPYDGRKNWADMLTAFCAAFRNTPDATLVFKLAHREYESAMHDMLIWMARMPSFQCRVILLQAYLEASEFENLVHATTFIVNASHGEGQCLPLMEFMSCGKPAIAPRHSAMVDYIDDDVAFIVDSWLDSTAWSHDPRLAYRTLRHQIDWASLATAYRAAYDCAKNDASRYQRMSIAAINRMQKHCSKSVAVERLEVFLSALQVSHT